jgi:hypothetical protein
MQAPAPQGRSSAVLVTALVAALAWGGIGAVVAFGLFKKTAATEAATSAVAATNPPVQTNPSSVPTNVPAATTVAEPAPTSSAAPDASASAAVDPKRAGSKTTWQSRTQPQPSSTTKPTRRPEIRSPFE